MTVTRRIGSRSPRGCVARARRGRELQDEIDRLSGAVEDDAQVDAGADFADLVAHRMRQERRLRVVQDDRRLADRTSSGRCIRRARIRCRPSGPTLLSSVAAGAVEDFALPGQPAAEHHGTGP